MHTHERHPITTSFARLASILAAVLALVVASGAAAQTVPAWEITRGDKSAYVIGTIHLGKPDFYPLPPPMHGAFDWAEVIAVELDSTRPDLQREVALRGTFGEGTDLEKAIGEESWAALQPVLATLGLDPAEAKRMRPWLLVSSMTVIAQARAGYLPDLGVDSALVRVGKANGRTVVELETFADQVAVLSEMSEKHGRAWLARVADQIASGRTAAGIAQLSDAWRAGDLEQVRKVVEAETAGDAVATEIATRIAESRGTALAKRAVELVDQGKRTVFAIHVANLAGPQGVMKRLEAAGFRVRQLTLESGVPAAPGSGRGAAGERPLGGAASGLPVDPGGSGGLNLRTPGAPARSTK